MAGTRLSTGAWMAMGWGLVYAALAGVIGLETGWGSHVRPPIPAPEQIPAANTEHAIQPEFALLPLQQGYAETTVRPIFTPLRRPPASPAQAAALMQKGQFVFLGALITGDKSIALLRDTAGKSVRVEQGKEIRGIKVAQIYPEKIILTQGNETEELTLKIQPSAKPSAIPKAVPVQQQAQQQPAQTAPPEPQSIPQTGVPGTAAPAVDSDPRSRINRRRAARGLPPL